VDRGPDDDGAQAPDVAVEALSEAREVLDRVGYSPAGLAARLGSGSNLRLSPDDVARARSSLEPDRPLDLVASMFLLGTDADEAVAAATLGATVETLVEAGLAERADGRLCPLVQLVPHDDLIVASDRPGSDPAADFVPGVQAPSDLLARLTPRERIRRALDVGTGCGIQALLLARHADEVVATDVSPRALRIARTNAALNRTTTIDFRLGSLLDPIGAERYDLVVANPPYVISPDHTYVFRDASGRGDELVHELVRGLPAVLADGGLAIVLVSWVTADGPPDPLSWTTDTRCGRLLLASRIQSAADTAHGWNKDHAADPVAYEERVARWLEFYRREDIASIGYGALVLSLDAEGRPGWAATVGAPLEGPGPGGPHVVRLVESHAALAAAAGRVGAVGRLVLAPDAELVERRRRGEDGLETLGVEIRLPGGIGTAADLDASGALLAMALERPRTLGEAIDIAATRLGLDRGSIEEAATAFVQSLLTNGFVQIAR
jgi:SAM-dependent methyltransferase